MSLSLSNSQSTFASPCPRRSRRIRSRAAPLHRPSCRSPLHRGGAPHRPAPRPPPPTFVVVFFSSKSPDRSFSKRIFCPSQSTQDYALTEVQCTHHFSHVTDLHAGMSTRSQRLPPTVAVHEGCSVLRRPPWRPTPLQHALTMEPTADAFCDSHVRDLALAPLVRDVEKHDKIPSQRGLPQRVPARARRGAPEVHADFDPAMREGELQVRQARQELLTHFVHHQDTYLAGVERKNTLHLPRDTSNTNPLPTHWHILP
jgi:hypothetical protein